MNDGRPIPGQCLVMGVDEKETDPAALEFGNVGTRSAGAHQVSDGLPAVAFAQIGQIFLDAHDCGAGWLIL